MIVGGVSLPISQAPAALLAINFIIARSWGQELGAGLRSTPVDDGDYRPTRPSAGPHTTMAPKAS